MYFMQLLGLYRRVVQKPFAALPLFVKIPIILLGVCIRLAGVAFFLIPFLLRRLDYTHKVNSRMLECWCYLCTFCSATSPLLIPASNLSLCHMYIHFFMHVGMTSFSRPIIPWVHSKSTQSYNCIKILFETDKKIKAIMAFGFRVKEKMIKASV